MSVTGNKELIWEARALANHLGVNDAKIRVEYSSIAVFGSASQGYSPAFGGCSKTAGPRGGNVRYEIGIYCSRTKRTRLRTLAHEMYHVYQHENELPRHEAPAERFARQWTERLTRPLPQLCRESGEGGEP
jgi:hypothetical protein